jgi:hypothetical protein
VNELDLVKLMLPDQTPHILTVGTGLTSEARCPGNVATREGGLIQDLPAMEVRDGNLRRWNEIKIVPSDPKKVFLKLGELTRSHKGLGLNQVRGKHLKVAVLMGVEIQHELR